MKKKGLTESNSVSSHQLIVSSLSLFVPELDNLQAALQKGLKLNFAEVEVTLVDCPDLSHPPFHLATSGLSGDQIVIELGGPTNVVPVADRSKVYDLVSMVRNISGYEDKQFFIGGATIGKFESCLISWCSTDVPTKLSR
jgi:hypothetical protein